jgi:rhodanese-related sulfurtransferase
LGAHHDETAVGEVDVATAWKGLQASPRSQLVDVRTRAEWTYVGIPDLGPLGKRAVLVRSLAAARAMAAAGFRACHNVSEGFEGPLDDERHRGTLLGWKAIGLPWQQG